MLHYFTHSSALTLRSRPAFVRLRRTSSSRPGNSLIEVIIAMGLLAVFGVAFLQLSLGSEQSGKRGEAQTVATAYARQGLEAVRSIGRQDFGQLAVGTHGIGTNGNVYTFSGSTNGANGYTRTITVAAVQRDSGDAIVPSGGTNDDETRLVTSLVEWTEGSLPRQITLTTYLTDWNLWRWIIDTFASFSAGARNGTAITQSGNGEAAPATTGNLRNPAILFTKDQTGTADVTATHIDPVSDRLLVSTTNNASGPEFLSYDISNVSASTTTLSGSLELGGTSSGFVLGSSYAYVISDNASNEIRVVRLKDMTQVASWNVPGSSLVKSITINETTQRAYVGLATNASFELYVYDISNPLTSSPTIVANVEVGQDVRKIALGNGYAYFLTNNTVGEVGIVNATTPSSVTTCDLTDTQLGNDIVVTNSRLFLTRNVGAVGEFIELAINPVSPSDCSYITTHSNGEVQFSSDALNMRVDTGSSLAFVTLRDPSAELAVVDLATDTATTMDAAGSLCDAVDALGAFVYLGCRDDTQTLQVSQGQAVTYTSQNVYTDSMQNSWTLSNAGGNTTNASNTFLVRTGANSLKISPAANGSTIFNKSLSIGTGSSLSFYVNAVSPWAFAIYSGNAGGTHNTSTVSNPTYGSAYLDNEAASIFSDFPTPNYASLKAQAQSTLSYINAGANDYTLNAAQLLLYSGKVIYVEFTNSSRVLTVNPGSSGVANASIIMTGGSQITLTDYNNATISTANPSYPVLASPRPIVFSANNNVTVNGLIYTENRIVTSALTGKQRVTLNGTIVAGTVDSTLERMVITYTTDFNTNPPLYFTPNYYGQQFNIKANIGNTVALNSYLTGGIDKNPTTWQLATIPASALGINGKTITSVQLLDATATNQSSIFLDDISWSLASPQSGTLYPFWSTYTSPILDTTSAATTLKRIKALQSGSGTITLRIRTGATQNDLKQAQWVGLGGLSSATYGVNSWQQITTDPASTGNRFVQWKAYFEGNGSQSPQLTNVTLTYTHP